MAEERGYFEDEGLSVTLIEGGPGVNPLTELEEGRVDAAISWLANQHSHHTNEAVSTINVAQILNIPSLVVFCRLETGVLRAEDLKGQRIGIWDLGDKAIGKQLLHQVGISPDSVEFVTQRSDGADLIDGSLPCVTAMEYNEQYAIFQSGITPAELLTLRPANYGIVVPEDGLYVATDRIESAEFQAVLTRFLRALRHGWLDASIAPHTGSRRGASPRTRAQ